jgi:GT2 family glycosyltransferase
MQLVSVVIPVYNQVALLDRCLASLTTQVGVEVEAIVVDDASPEDPSEVVRSHADLRINFQRCERNQGYAEANNRGLREAKGEFILFLNSDTELAPDTLARLVAYFEAHPEAGGVAPVHRGTDGEIQRTCSGFPTLPVGWVWDSVTHRRRPDHPVVRQYTLADWDYRSERWVEAAQTSCLLVRRVVYEKLGGMDPNLFLFYNDTDFCHRMSREGYPIRFLADVEILHHGSASVQTFDRAEAQIFGDRYRYFRKWYGWRGAFAVRFALWSRVWYEALVELAHGDLKFAARKFRRGLSLSRAMVGAP